MNSSKDTICGLADTSDTILTQYLLTLSHHVTAPRWKRFQGTSINCSLTPSGHLTWALWIFLFLQSHWWLSMSVLFAFPSDISGHWLAVAWWFLGFSRLFQASPSLEIFKSWQEKALINLIYIWIYPSLEQEGYTRDVQSPFQSRSLCDSLMSTWKQWNFGLK